ncbi:MAG: CvpA family protein [Salinivirgaceae bacterium]
MNYFDLILAVPLLWGLYKGFSKGLVKSLATLVALVVGIIGAMKFSHLTSVFLVSNFSIGATYLPLVSFAITFLGIVVAVHLLARFLDKVMSAVALGGINKIAGAVFGVAKFAFILSVLLIILNYIDAQVQFMPKEKTEDSVLYRPIANFAPTIIPYIDLDKLKEKVEEHVPGQDSLPKTES